MRTIGQSGRKEVDNNFHLHDRQTDVQTDGWTNGHGMTAKTALMRSISWLKLHQIALMCWYTLSYLLTTMQCPVDSNSKL